MKRGDVYWADLDPRSGSEQKGRCPVVVVSHDGFNETPAWMSIIVVPISTSVSRSKRGPTVVAVPRGVAGLSKPSLAICHQVITLDRGKLTRRIGALPAEILVQLERGSMAAMDLDE